RFYRGRLQRVEDALAQAAEPERFSAALTELLSDRLSYFDMEAREPEKTYHVFVLGLLASAGIRCLSNRESGFGRYDLLAVFPDKSIVFEFKQTGEATKIGEAADEAFRQIIDRKYADGASEGLPVYGVGIGFHNKTCAVKTAQIRK
ncbi:MAG: PD-(D/E)XK nuclease domain-containing protein, partial [Acidobacteriota bacterium]|nr:PD-(D/E)XK nuclease domain-containing protein [Acidobacteriota bacterium]